jgi:hypothetical protein
VVALIMSLNFGDYLWRVAAILPQMLRREKCR